MNVLIKLIRFSLLLIFSVVAASCVSTRENSAVHIDEKNIDMMGVPAAYSTVQIKEKSDILTSCHIPPHDAVKSASESIGFKIHGVDNAVLSDGDSALALGGRNPAVLLTRELLFRACELSSNYDYDKEEVLKIYGIFLNHVDNIVREQKKLGSETVSGKRTELKSLSDEGSKSKKDAYKLKDEEEEEEEEEEER